MNLGTAITLLIVGGLLFFALRSIVRDFRSGTSKCDECGGGCGKTSCSSCDVAEQMAAKLDAIP
ncbi:MAG: FeoB-associated Cys-rich membrane protein [Eggerthellaceae bacterium]|nr:FeoB-associated Cys-rich membrane protein [Eggerthellaceae bacterium]